MEISSIAERGCLKELCLASNTVWKCNKVPEGKMGILWSERSMVREMCGVQLIDRKRSTGLMCMFGLRETIDQLAMAKNVHLYGHVFRKETFHVL